ncbi:hypothetical protein K501DRAFT_337851 [Backusella circina FSU 941]|nr:hypothetical protein K501DRAFT_337851 [Backusella circina FSU 941]
MPDEVQQISPLVTQIRAAVHRFKLPALEEVGLFDDTDPQKCLTLCPACRSPFIKPTTLSCGYTLCYNCIPSSTNFQCPSFICLRNHTNLSKPTVLVEEIQSSVLIGKNNQYIKTLLDCPICFTTLSDPTTTECGHTFCRACLNQVTDDFHYKQCPICRSKLKNVHRCNQLLHRWVLLFSESPSVPGKARSEYMPVIEVDSIVIFPSQSCLVHVSKDYALFKEMAETPKQTHYALCLSKNKNDHYDCIGTMLQISNIEYIPDLRKCVILAKGLYHVQLDNIAIEGADFTGNIKPLNYELLDPYYVSLSKSKRWTLPTPTMIKSGEQKSPESCSSTDNTTPRKRRRPCSMRSSLSSPNQTTYRQDSVIPGAYTRLTWNDLIQKQVYSHSSTPLLSVVSNTGSQKPISQ